MRSCPNDPYGSYNDLQLLELLKVSDEAAFTELYNRYNAAIYTYLLSFVKQSFLAEDLAHEVFMKIWDHRSRISITSSFPAYLYRICHNEAVDALKKIASDQALRKEVLNQLPSQLPEAGHVAPSPLHYEQMLEQAIASLPPQRQKVYILCREEGKTYDEAARTLGISRNTVKEHMVHSLRHLRHYFAEKEDMILVLILLGHLF